MGREASKGDRSYEIEVETSWGPLLDPEFQPSKVSQPDKREVFLISEVFMEAECRALIAESERGENRYGATNYPKHYRGNLRLITKDTSLTAAVWQRLKELVPAVVVDGDETWDAIGLNECWRLAKYHPGDRFQKHCDAPFDRSRDERSLFTVNIYMNGDFEGGSTRFYRGSTKDVDLEVKPEPGLCLIFRQPPAKAYYHDGEEVRSGVKYLFRSDVMYRRRA